MPAEKYAKAVLFLSIAHVVVVSCVLFNLIHGHLLTQKNIEFHVPNQVTDTPEATRQMAPSRTSEDLQAMEIGDIKVSDNREDLVSRLTPPGTTKADAVLQIDNETVVVVGGFIDNFQNVSRAIHFLNVQTQTWMPNPIPLPTHIAETHQGIAYDGDKKILYIVSGQLGGGCLPATRSCVRLWIQSRVFEDLPQLPEARYSPGVEIVADPLNSSHKYLHVFGGASLNRKDGATDHWRLVLNGVEASSQLQQLTWQTLEPLPDAGIHGASFLSSQGYLHYTAYCSMDQSVLLSSSSMTQCHEHAADSGQLLHHVSDVGLTFRYPVWQQAIAGNERLSPRWERIADMPFPTCHAGSVVHGDQLYVVGGGLSGKQSRLGSAPRSLPLIQVLNAKTMKWAVFPFRLSKKRMQLFLLLSWLDQSRSKLYSLHPGNVLIAAKLHTTVSPVNNNNTKVVKTIQVDEYALRRTRHVNIEAFQACLKIGAAWHDQLATNATLDIYSVLDKDTSVYESVRGTWNERNRARQYPDMVVFPLNNQHVSAIVQCGRRTGYHLCARNGKHSYDGSSICSRGIVVDVSQLSNWGVYQSVSSSSIEARFGAGMTLGQVADALHSHGLALPMGSCASVGLTGLTLSGGQGPMSRAYGLTCDHLQSIEFVDANGNVRKATDDNAFSDVLWLARGGGTVGPHFPGIITSLTFHNLVSIPPTPKDKDDPTTDRLSHVSEQVWTRARIRFPANVASAVDLLMSWHEFLQTNQKQEDGLEKSSLQWLEYSRRLTVEPWIQLSPKKKMNRQNQKNYSSRHSTNMSVMMQPSVFLNAYFFGNDTLHSDVFLPHMLPMLQNWVVVVSKRDDIQTGAASNATTTAATPAAGRLVLMERLDHLSFQRKLGGVRTHSELISGRHGHDLDHVSWKGYSAVCNDDLYYYLNKSLPLSSSFQQLRSALELLVRSILLQQSQTTTTTWRRYAEFKPLGGAIRTGTDTGTGLVEPSASSSSSSAAAAAFPHRQALWWVLVNHFYPSQSPPSASLSSSSQSPQQQQQQQQQKSSIIANDADDADVNGSILVTTRHHHARFIEALQNANMYGGMYAGYVDHEDPIIVGKRSSRSTSSGLLPPPTSLIMEEYYGKDHAKRIMDIKRRFDPYNIFRRWLPFPTTKATTTATEVKGE